MKERIQHMKVVKFVSLYVAFALMSFAQTAIPVQVPPPSSPNVSVSPVGTAGFSTYYYMVIANFPSGATQSQIVTVQSGNATLNGTNYNQLGWQALPGVLNWDILKLSTNAFTGSCTCSLAVAQAAATLTYSDQGGGLSSYTIGSPALAANAAIYIDNTDYAFPKLRVSIGNAPQGTQANHLAEIPSGTGLPAYSTAGDLFIKLTNAPTGCYWSPSANTWLSCGTSGGQGALVVSFTAGTGGTTANQLVKLTSTNTVVKTLTSDTGLGVAIGVAQTTATAGSQVFVAIAGVTSCVADTGGITAGNLIGVGTTVADTCIDLGQTAPGSVAQNINIVGRALTTVTATNAATVYLLPVNTQSSIFATAPVPSTAGGVALGSASLPFTNVFFAGSSGTPASNNGEFTGTFTGLRVFTLPDASVSLIGGSLADCATTAACPSTVKTTIHTVIGIGTLNSGTPSTYAVTTISPAFTSAASYTCAAQDATTIANNIGVLTAGYISGTAVTFTGPNTNTDTFRFVCTGY